MTVVILLACFLPRSNPKITAANRINAPYPGLREAARAAALGSVLAKGFISALIFNPYD
ncbi:MAG: hypothetical protein HY674_13380 [Chloroflexi bacterium]|nr:hypothetical protein [Chloroflexota bacterium]